MLVQYLVSQGATYLRKSKIESLKAVNSPQVNKERTFRVHLLVKSFCIVFQQCILRQNFRLSFLLHLRPKFQANVFIKKRVFCYFYNSWQNPASRPPDFL